MVQWKDFNVEDATWEPKEVVIASFEEEYRIKVESLDSMSISEYRKVASSNASRFVTRLVYIHTQNDNFLIRSPS